MAVAYHRFHFFNMLFYITYPKTVKAKFVHGLQHSRMNKITLKANVIIVPHVDWVPQSATPSKNYHLKKVSQY